MPKLGEMRGKSLPEPMRLLGTKDHVLTPIEGTNEPLLTVQNLTTHFPVKGGFLRRTVANVHAVEDVSFVINKGADALFGGRIWLWEIHGGALDLATG